MVRFKRIPIKPAAGGGVHFPLAEKSIRLARYGCTNRPFYHIVVNMKRRHQHDQSIEQLGTFDPLPNKYNESLVSLNIERLRYWLSHRTTISKPVAVLLGISGFLPMHPFVFIRAWKMRANELQYQSKKLEENECVDSEENKPEDSEKLEKNECVDSEENKPEDSDKNT